VSDPHRQSYRIEERIRSPTPEEREIVRGREATWRAAVIDRELRTTWDLLPPSVVAAAVLLLGWWRSSLPAAIAGGALAVLMAVMWWLARANARKRAAHAKSPWDAPDSGWQVRELFVVARALVVSASGDEDYGEWWLFEIPNGDWFYVDPIELPSFDAPRAEIRLASLHPNGPYLHGTSNGEELPRRGAPHDDYAKAVEMGFVWRPESATTDGRVTEATLPEWMRA
jgi:hypothetical protein